MGTHFKKTSPPLNSGCPKTNQAPRNGWLNTDLIALTGYAGYLRFTLRVNETAFSTAIELRGFAPIGMLACPGAICF
jgi:hypothetical protein